MLWVRPGRAGDMAEGPECTFEGSDIVLCVFCTFWTLVYFYK